MNGFTSEDTRENIYLINKCHLCHEVYSKPPTLVNHLKRAHNRITKPRASGYIRPLNENYMYVKDEYSADSVHFACPSCWFHCSIDDPESYYYHIDENHIKSKRGNPSEEKNNSGEVYMKRRSSRTKRRSSVSNKSEPIPQEKATHNEVSALLDSMKSLTLMTKKLLGKK